MAFMTMLLRLRSGISPNWCSSCASGTFCLSQSSHIGTPVDQAGAPAGSSEALCGGKGLGGTGEPTPGVAAECAEPGELPTGLRERSELYPWAAVVPETLPKSRPGHELNIPSGATGARCLAEAIATCGRGPTYLCGPPRAATAAERIAVEVVDAMSRTCDSSDPAFQALEYMHANFVTRACRSTWPAHMLQNRNACHGKSVPH